jgi:hypothetical protein
MHYCSTHTGTLKFWKFSQQLVYSQPPMCIISEALYLGIKKPAVSSGLEID